VATFDGVRSAARDLPEAEERPAYGTPSIRVGTAGRIAARLREDGEQLAIVVTEADRLALPQTDPDVYSIPEHYARSRMIVVHLPSADPDGLRELVIEAWRLVAPKRAVRAFEER
jgi:hypothetical protein